MSKDMRKASSDNGKNLIGKGNGNGSSIPFVQKKILHRLLIQNEIVNSLGKLYTQKPEGLPKDPQEEQDFLNLLDSVFGEAKEKQQTLRKLACTNKVYAIIEIDPNRGTKTTSVREAHAVTDRLVSVSVEPLEDAQRAPERIESVPSCACGRRGTHYELVGGKCSICLQGHRENPCSECGKKGAEITGKCRECHVSWELTCEGLGRCKEFMCSNLSETEAGYCSDCHNEKLRQSER